VSTRGTITHGDGRVDTFEFTDDREGHAFVLLARAAIDAGMPSVQVNARNGSVVVDLTDITAINEEARR
jgi:hypothetical protein